MIGLLLQQALLLQVVEVDAFASVHDMIHAAITSYGKQATLREVSTSHAWHYVCPKGFLRQLLHFVCRSTKPVSCVGALLINALVVHASSHTMTTGRVRFVMLCTPVTGLPGETFCATYTSCENLVLQL